jgi:hypothetical protein
MEVELDGALLDSPSTESLSILALCAFGLQGRHRVMPDDRGRWDDWASLLPTNLREEVQLAWDEGERRAAEDGPSERVQVRPPGACNWVHGSIVVDLAEALALLGRPLRIMLENNRNDRAFVLAFADEASARALKTAEDAGWLVFETCGGIGELKIRASAARLGAPAEVLRTMYLCDSDALEPNTPSDLATAVNKHLLKLERRFSRPPTHFGRVLTRRAAENYAPPGAVLEWAVTKFGSDDAWRLIRLAESPAGRRTLAIGAGEAGTVRRRLVAAIALKELQPHPEKVCEVLDMKEGRGPSDGRRTTDKVWHLLDAFQQAALADGFGGSFSARFYLDQRHLRDETGEVSGFLAKILERL